MRSWRTLLPLALLAALHATLAHGQGTDAPPLRAAVPAAPAPSLWPLPTSQKALRATGESSHMEWPVYIPAGALAGIRSFQLAFQAAVEVMPEASNITLTINGQFVGRVPIAAPRGVSTQAIDVPPGLLVQGWNAVSLDVVQAHRVDCTLASTYELWTQIDAGRTGFRGTPPSMGTIADLPALPTDAAGETPLHLVLPKAATPADLGRAVRVLELLALRAHFEHPVVDTAARATGLNVAVGTADFLATIPGLAKPVQPVQLSTAADGGLWLTVLNGDGDPAQEALGLGTPRGSEEGLKALARRSGLRLRPGSALTLADLGLKSQAFAGRVYHAAFDVVLPPDAFPADYAEARLAIDGGYAAGLARGARLLVRVNGVIDGSFDLDRPGGAVLQDRPVNMPLGPFRPGRNRVELEAQLPAKIDETCDTLNAIGAKERLMLLGTSTLSLPPLARVARFPGLSATLTGALRVVPDVPARLYVPRLTDAAIAAVGTLLSNAAVFAGVPTGVVLQRGTPAASAEPAIVVGEVSDIPAQLIDAVGIDPQSVSQAWRSGGRRGAADDGTSSHADLAVSDASRLDVWGERVQSDNGWLGAPGSLLSLAGDRLTATLRGAGLVQRTDRPLVATGDTTFIVAQGLDHGVPLTLVTGRDGPALSQGSAELTSPARVAWVSGRAVSFDSDADGATVVPARDTAFFRTQPFSFVNDRLVAAGWVSTNASWYIGAVLLVVTSLGVATWLRLSTTRKGPHA